MATISFDTPRLTLDLLLPSDAAALFAYRSDPDAARYQGWRPANIEEAAAFISRQASETFGRAESWFQLAIRRRGSGELVGDLGIHFPAAVDEAIEFGLSLRRTQQGNGYAREAMHAVIDRAFSEWGYGRVIGSVDPRNASSVALLRALGFRQEAYHVESLYLHGEWVDDAVFALLAREWTVSVK